MTNADKFKETFGYEPAQMCLLPIWICVDQGGECDNCPFKSWWDKEYKPCFKLKENLDGE